MPLLSQALRWQNAKRAAGCCPPCGKARPAKAIHILCEDCRRKRREYQRARTRKLRLATAS